MAFEWVKLIDDQRAQNKEKYERIAAFMAEATDIELYVLWDSASRIMKQEATQYPMITEKLRGAVGELHSLMASPHDGRHLVSLVEHYGYARICDRARKQGYYPDTLRWTNPVNGKELYFILPAPFDPWKAI